MGGVDLSEIHVLPDLRQPDHGLSQDSDSYGGVNVMVVVHDGFRRGILAKREITMRTLGLLAIFLLSACGGGTPDTAQTAAHTPQTVPAPATQPGPVVFIGDSITAYWPLQNYFPGVIDAGIGGQVCNQMLARFQTDVLDQYPSVVVIECGTNDIRYYNWSDLSPLFDMVEQAEASGAKVVVAELPPNTGWGTGSPLIGHALYEKWNSEIKTGASQYGYVVADYYDAMVLSDGQQNATLFQSDGTHPNTAGYDVMASVLRPVLSALGY